MCGRFYFSQETKGLIRDWIKRANRGDAPGFLDTKGGSYDVRPTNQIVVVRPDDLVEMRWGWKRDFSSAIINATCEKLTGRFWNKSLRERRGIIPADGWYECKASPCALA